MFRKATLMWTILLALTWVAAGMAGPRQVPTVQLSAEAEIAAPPAAVWAFMTSGKNAVTWCPAWKSEKNVAVTIAKVGDVLDYSDEWGKNGRSVVTYMVKDKELRVAHEPNDGSYMCQARLVLTPAGSGTKVRYEEQYTDASEAKDLAATAAKVEAEMNQTLADLKKGVEKK